MSKFKRCLRSFYKNFIKKRKFKSYFQSLFDSEYRNQINELYELTKNTKRVEYKSIPIDAIMYGHKIIYPEYASELVHRVRQNPSIPIPPIKIVSWGRGRYKIVDGNHRFLAVQCKALKENSSHVICKVLI